MSYIFRERNGLIDFYIDDQIADGIFDYIEFDTNVPKNVSFSVLPENLDKILDILHKKTDTSHKNTSSIYDHKSRASLYIHRGI